MKLNANEAKIIKALSSDDRMTYFVNHVLDNDEIQSLADDNGWYTKTISDAQVIQLWPYEEYVELPSENEKKGISLASYMDKYISEFIKSDRYIEIYPVKDDAGKFYRQLILRMLLMKKWRIIKSD